MVERRRHFRFQPGAGDDEIAVVENRRPAGIVSNYSEGGICIVMHAGPELHVGQVVGIDYRGHTAQAVVRNVTRDAMTTAYGLEWIQPIDVAMLPRRLSVVSNED